MNLRPRLSLFEDAMSDYFHKVIFGSAVIWYMVTAINSSGFYHPDEHYQVIEFARYKLGIAQAGDLAWEYKAAIRSAIQPAICFAVFKACYGIGLENPHMLSLLLRIITAILSLSAITFFVRRTLPQLSTAYHKIYILLSYFLWFLPFLNVRFSSETWSGIFLLPAVALIQSNRKINWQEYWLSGVCMGLSFLFRFQAGIIVASLLLWLIFVRKINFRAMSVILAGILPVLAMGVLLDSWMYGKLECTAWNYFKVNLVDDVASDYGVMPWYQIIQYIVDAPIIPLGVFIIVSIVIMLISKPPSIFLWTITPLIVVHTCIPHKELRFLFPIVNFIPVVLIQGGSEITKWGRQFPQVRSALIYTMVLCFLFINLTGLVALGFKAAGAGRSAITGYIHRQWNGQPVQLLYTDGCNPYKPWDILKEGHYEPQRMTTHMLRNLEELSQISPASQDTVKLIVLRQYYLDDPWFEELTIRKGYSFRMQGVPDWVLWLNRFYKGFNEEEVLALYEVTHTTTYGIIKPN